MVKKALTKNQKIGIGAGVILGLGALVFLIYVGHKNKKKVEACRDGGGEWDKDTKKCIGGTYVAPVKDKKDSSTTYNNDLKDQLGGLDMSNAPSSPSPFGNLPMGKSSCERYVERHDSAWNYVKCGGTWYTQRKGGTSWTSLAGNTTAVNKLEAYSGS